MLIKKSPKYILRYLDRKYRGLKRTVSYDKWFKDKVGQNR